MARTHLVLGGCSANASLSVCLGGVRRAHLSLLPVPQVQAGWETQNQGYSQDVGDDAYAPAKQRTGKSGPPGPDPRPAWESPHGSQGEWSLGPPWWASEGPTALSIPSFSSTLGGIQSHQTLDIEPEDISSRSDSCPCRLGWGMSPITSEPLSPHTVRTIITTSQDCWKDFRKQFIMVLSQLQSTVQIKQFLSAQRLSHCGIPRRTTGPRT